MSRLRFLVLFASILAASMTPRPARAQAGFSLDGFNGGLEGGAGVLGAVVVAGGTTTFLAVDLAYISQRRPIPVPWTVLQVTFGTIVAASGGVLAKSGNEAAPAVLIPLGSTVALVPLVHLGVRAARRPRVTSVGFTSTGVVVSGRF